MKKLWNRMLSLTLVLVMVLGMLPTAAAQEEASATRTVYLDVTEEKWGKAYVYFWSDEYAYLTTWPGEVMTLVKEGVYSYQVPAEAELVIFNNGNTQTRDLTLPTDGKDLYDLSSDSWTVYGQAQVTANGVTTVYATVREAVDAATLAEGSTVTLLSDISATEPVRVYSGRFTIDLNGKTWTESNTVLDLRGGDVRIIDSSAQGTGSLVSEAYAAIDLSSDAKLEVAGGTV